MKKIEFADYDLTEKAFEVYSNSDFRFYENNGVYYYSVGSEDEKSELGDMAAVERFLLEFAE